MNRAAGARQQQPEQQQQQGEGDEAEAPADTGSPCGSSASGGWQQAAPAAGAAPPPAAASDVDSDILLLHAQVPAKGGGESAHSVDSWAVRTPPGAAEAAAGSRLPPPLPALRRVRGEEVPPGMRRTGSGNLEWISAVGKEWLNVSAASCLWVVTAAATCLSATAA